MFGGQNIIPSQTHCWPQSRNMTKKTQQVTINFNKWLELDDFSFYCNLSIRNTFALANLLVENNANDTR